MKTIRKNLNGLTAEFTTNMTDNEKTNMSRPGIHSKDTLYFRNNKY